MCISHHLVCPSSFLWYNYKLYCIQNCSMSTTGISYHHKQAWNLWCHLLPLKVKVHKHTSESDNEMTKFTEVFLQNFIKEISTYWFGQCSDRWRAWLIEAQWNQPHPLTAPARVQGCMVLWELRTGISTIACNINPFILHNYYSSSHSK